MISTTIYCNIESTLSDVSNEIEKEEATAFKAYIQLAIAQFVEVDSSPPPPQISTYTRPTKGERTLKDKITVKKDAIELLQKQKGIVLNRRLADETPSLPKIPQMAENTRIRGLFF
ncbi:hypothetical protein EPUL_006631, partial [Erysiphe pulchra]